MNSKLKIYAGVDVGSVSIKAALASGGKVLASALTPSGGNYRDGAERILEQVLAEAGVAREQLAGIVSTGVGAESVPFSSRRVSDLSCQAAGCIRLFPAARTVIDIGGQFTKVALMTAQGRITDFLISEKCATGSGRFLQVIARILGIRIEEIGPLSLKSRAPVEFSTNCAVFAESETISRIAEGARPEDILAGVHRAMAAKVSMLVRRVRMAPEVVLTGGGGEDAGLAAAVNQALGLAVRVPENPRLTAATGAAFLAEEEEDG